LWCFLDYLDNLDQSSSPICSYWFIQKRHFMKRFVFGIVLFSSALLFQTQLLLFQTQLSLFPSQLSCFDLSLIVSISVWLFEQSTKSLNWNHQRSQSSVNLVLISKDTDLISMRVFHFSKKRIKKSFFGFKVLRTKMSDMP